VGEDVGSSDGTGVGSGVGDIEGMELGRALGSELGSGVGGSVGTNEGRLLGALLGLRVWMAIDIVEVSTATVRFIADEATELKELPPSSLSAAVRFAARLSIELAEPTTENETPRVTVRARRR